MRGRSVLPMRLAASADAAVRVFKAVLEMSRVISKRRGSKPRGDLEHQGAGPPCQSASMATEQQT